jgi:1-phosphatidylinositol-4-phosphate 5-kinase
MRSLHQTHPSQLHFWPQRQVSTVIRVSHGLLLPVCLQVRFVVMANIFVTDLQIHRRYDIKGSTEGRTVGPGARSK